MHESGARLMRAATLRRATPDDIDAILELNAVGNGRDIAEEMAVVFEHGAMAASDYAVAVVDGQVVATVGLLATTLLVGGVRLPVGQPEYIATDPDFQGHGLAGRLLARVQEWSEDRGDLVQVITGVPYFYRQFGYSYGLVRPPELAVPGEHELVMPPGWQVRAAAMGDVDRIRELQATAQAAADVALCFADNLWPTFLALPAAPLLVAVRDGSVGAIGRLRLTPGSPVHIQALAADEVQGVAALLAGARARFPGATLLVAEREGSVTRAVVGEDASLVSRRKSVYSRVVSLARLLGAVTPVLDQRLSGSALAAEGGVLDISTYTSAVRLRYELGRVVEVTEAAAIHEPDDVGAVGVPPDLVPQLVFGEGGALAIEDHPDVHLGRHRPLMATFFPRQRVDLLTW